MTDENNPINTACFFEYYYNNAEVNSILIMDGEGTMLDVNRAFTANFGYRSDDIRGKNFSELFNETDQQKGKPQRELETIAAYGQAHDENYIMNKEGDAIWCMGEALLVKGEHGENYIVKDLINLQAKKQVQLFLNDTEELLEKIFLSSKELPMMILDGGLKVQKVNGAFQHLFELENLPAPGSRVADLTHPFWSREEIRDALRQILVNNEALKDREFIASTKEGKEKRLRISSKTVNRQSGLGRSLFIIINEV